MSFTVTILGSGAALPTKTRNPTSQYVECRGRKIVIDCGEGTQVQFRKYGVKFQKVEHILISHLHGDHYFGLVGLLSSMHLLGRKKSIEIYGPDGLKQILDLQLQYGGSRLSFEINFHTLDTTNSGIAFEDDKILIKHFPLSHKVPTNGFLIQEKEKERTLLIEKCQRDNIKIQFYQYLKRGENVLGDDGKEIRFEDYTLKVEKSKSYAFCSDTRYFEPIIEEIKDVNLLYHEATFTEDFRDRAKSTMHSTTKDAANIAKKASVGKLLLGHLSARYENGSQHELEAREIFENSVIVEDGDKFEVI
ncbi:MAG TPA: ribonuclease Z [Crocinitomicaceae bacterium]|nr:ribonuclease Z [Crocinitomicaceae bacterium]